jgi:flagellar biosynthesis protein FlhG
MDREQDPKGTRSDTELELFQEPELEEGEVAPPSVELEVEAGEDASPQQAWPVPVRIRRVRASEPPPAPPGGPLPDSSPEEPRPSRPRLLRLIAVSGAKGGVGKTVLAANLGLYLASIGRRVVLVDADPGGANLHTCLGIPPAIPLRIIKKSAHGDSRSGPKVPAEAMAATPFAGLRLMRTGIDTPEAHAERSIRQAKLLPRLRTVDADYVVVDLGGGVNRELLDAYLAADQSIFVTVPEPPAIENTYRFLRGAFTRFLLSRISDDEVRADLGKRLKAMGGAPSPLDLMRDLAEENHPLADSVRDALTAFEPRLLVNQTRLRADLELGYNMQSAARRRLGITIDCLGHVDNDDTVWNCVRNRRPLLLESPGTKSSKKIEKFARRLLVTEAGKPATVQRRSVPADIHHDLLEVERGATDEEIRRAYKRCRDIYAPHSLCCYGLFEPHELEKLRVRLDEAFDVLLDPARRRPYELSVFTEEPGPEEIPPPEEPELEAAAGQPEVTPDTHFTGALLRQIRRYQRVQLRDVAQTTKIGMNYLKAIEEDDYGALPALVYARGFIGEYAKYLKLDPQQVSRTYIKRYREYLDQLDMER